MALSLALFLKASEAMQVDQRVAMWAPCDRRNYVPKMHWLESVSSTPINCLAQLPVELRGRGLPWPWAMWPGSPGAMV